MHTSLFEDGHLDRTLHFRDVEHHERRAPLVTDMTVVVGLGHRHRVVTHLQMRRAREGGTRLL